MQAVARMGSQCCGYAYDVEAWTGPNHRCDCKYGVADPENPWPTAAREVTGCPELRSVHDALAQLTDEEWARLVQRAGGIPSGAVLEGETVGDRFALALPLIKDGIGRLEHAARLLTDRPGEGSDG